MLHPRRTGPVLLLAGLYLDQVMFYARLILKSFRRNLLRSTLTSLAIMGMHHGGNAKLDGQIYLDGEELIGADPARVRRLRGSKMAMITLKATNLKIALRSSVRPREPKMRDQP